METKLSFALVPDPETANLLISAPDAKERRHVLVQRKEHILASCEPILALCVNAASGPWEALSARQSEPYRVAISKQPRRWRPTSSTGL